MLKLLISICVENIPFCFFFFFHEYIYMLDGSITDTEYIYDWKRSLYLAQRSTSSASLRLFFIIRLIMINV